MKLIHLYGRVLALLGPEAGLGWFLALANVALAAAQFAEPVLFGRIIDALASAQKAGSTLTFDNLLPLLAAWAAFGLFTIGCGVFVALHADRLVASQASGGADRIFRARACNCRSPITAARIPAG